MVNEFRDEAQARHRLVVFNTSHGSEAFLISKETTPFLKPSRTIPSDREHWTSLVIQGKRISKHSLIRKVSHGSSRQDFSELVNTFDIILRNRFKDVKFSVNRASMKSEVVSV